MAEMKQKMTLDVAAAERFVRNLERTRYAVQACIVQVRRQGYCEGRYLAEIDALTRGDGDTTVAESILRDYEEPEPAREPFPAADAL